MPEQETPQKEPLREKFIKMIESVGLVVVLLAVIASFAREHGHALTRHVVPLYVAGFALMGLPPIFSDRFGSRTALGKTFVVLSLVLCVALVAVLIFNVPLAR